MWTEYKNISVVFKHTSFKRKYHEIARQILESSCLFIGILDEDHWNGCLFTQRRKISTHIHMTTIQYCLSFYQNLHGKDPAKYKLILLRKMQYTLSKYELEHEQENSRNREQKSPGKWLMKENQMIRSDKS